jgi:hypothetical protein
MHSIVSGRGAILSLSCTRRRLKIRQSFSGLLQCFLADVGVVLAHLFAVMTCHFHDDSLRDAGFFEEGYSGLAEGMEK